MLLTYFSFCPTGREEMQALFVCQRVFENSESHFKEDYLRNLYEYRD